MLVDVLVGLVVVLTVLYIIRSQKRLSLPPGPRGLPLIGNLLDFPKDSHWKVYSEWASRFNSDVVSIKIFGDRIVILHTYEAAQDLLEKRSSIYSSRPRTLLLTELAGYGFAFGILPYGESWRTRRRIFSQHFHPQNPQIHQPSEILYTNVLLGKLLRNPDQFLEHMRHAVGSIALSMMYGIKILPENDPYINLTEEAMELITDCLVPGMFLVDSFPILRYIPEWFPGAGFQKRAKRGRKESIALRTLPFGAAEKALRDGTILPCFVSQTLAEAEIIKDEEEKRKYIQMIKEISVQGFVGAADTSVSAFGSFVLAMVNYPEAQKKAQKELDEVLNGRLPVHSDIPSLPYITAILREILRWQPTVPTGVAHLLTEDDVYNGYHIPKGSILLPNIKAMLHDETLYPDPETFNPDRFITPDGKLNNDIRNPEDVAFGFGRRICPGRHLARSSIWLAVASILAVFDIQKAVDENGELIEPTGAYEHGGVTHPAPFKCSIKPRSPAAAALVSAAAGFDD
ncbi:cytochrome P450 [Cyathus striatus]|nr:cytochrome P450 [Cyathus striatus]